MPNWIDDEGYNWFGKIECKRCLKRFTANPDGEVPLHECVDGTMWTSASEDGEWHYPIPKEPTSD